MNRDSGSEQPGQRTVAELLAEYGKDSSGKTGTRRRRRRAEDPTETAPHAIIDRVLSDSGKMRPVDADGHPVSPNAQSSSGPAAQQSAPAPPPGAQQPPAAQQAPGGQQPPAGQQPTAPPQPSAPPQAPAGQQPQHPATQQQPPLASPPPAQQPGGAQQGAQPPGSAQPPEPQQPSQSQRVQGPPVPASQPPAPSGPPPSAPPAAAPGRQPADPAQQEPSEDEAPGGPSANVWAQRFAAAAGGPTSAASAQASAPAAPDQEQTTRQPALYPQNPAQDGGHTEQFPPVDAADEQGTAVVPVPQNDPYASGGDLPRAAEQDPYDPYGGQAHEQPFGTATGYDDSYADGNSEFDGYADAYADGDEFAADYDEFDEYPDDRPAGMGDDDYDDSEESASPGREWATFAAQMGVGLVGGGILWVCFRWLWITIPVAALVAALVVTGALVLVARKFLRGDDVQTVLLAVLVGLVCTVSPAALLLIGQ